MKSMRSNSLRLKYQRFASSDWKNKGFRKLQCVAKTKFLKIQKKTENISPKKKKKIIVQKEHRSISLFEV